MAIGDEQIDRLTKNLQAVADKTVGDIDRLLSGKIEEVRELLNGISFQVNSAQIKKPNGNGPA